jgi:hypothetical protein
MMSVSRVVSFGDADDKLKTKSSCSKKESFVVSRHHLAKNLGRLSSLWPTMSITGAAVTAAAVATATAAVTAAV